MTKPIRNTGPCFHLSLPRQRGQRDVLSHTEFINVHILHALSLPGHPSPSSYEKATHGKLVGPTLSTPRGDKYYNQYRPLCEVCQRDRGKVVETLQGGQSLREISEMIVEPKSESVLTRQGILVAKALIDPNSERIPLRVMNLTDANAELVASVNSLENSDPSCPQVSIRCL